MPPVGIESDTIAAIATALGVGSVGIVRVSGPQAFSFTDLLTRPPTPAARRRGYGLYRVRIHSPNCDEILDDGLIAVFHKPRSFTGENVVEFHGHGGPLIVKRVFAAFLAVGARAARPGEFSERAFANGKMDLSQAEAVADLIGAGTEAAARAARRQLEGELSFAIERCSLAIKESLAFLEAAIDFPEEVGNVSVPVVQDALIRAENGITDLLKSANYGRRLREGITVVLAGRPNVGKSSLLNRLSGTDRAIVTPHAGTTRDVLEESLQIRGMPVRAWDTAGLRDADDPIEKIGIERARRAVRDADIVIVVWDATVTTDAEEEDLLRSLRDRPTIVALNKADTAAPDTLRTCADAVQRVAPGVSCVAVSALTGEGMGRLADAVAETLTGDATAADPLVTSARHEAALQTARASLENARRTLDTGFPPELVAVDAHAALQSLGEITGATAREDIIADIFSRFCIGK